MRGLAGIVLFSCSTALAPTTTGCRRAAPGLAPVSETDAARVDASPAIGPDAEAAGGAAAGDGAAAGIALSPIPPDPLFTNLTVPGYPEAVVSVPNGATTRRPVLVVLHGIGDRPDWNCDAWRHIIGARGFVLCPRGQYEPESSTKDDRRFTLRGKVRAHVEGALAALAQRFGPYVDIDRPLVAGFSLGATEIGRIALAVPARYPRVALVEGGDGVWSAARVASFSSRGGRRVLFGCGSPWCVPLAKQAAASLAKGRIEARRVFAPVGHTTDRPLQEALRSELAWFVDGDPRWSDGP
jgi:predicted esterase